MFVVAMRLLSLVNGEYQYACVGYCFHAEYELSLNSTSSFADSLVRSLFHYEKKNLYTIIKTKLVF